MLLLRRPGLVVPVVDQAKHRPALLVLTEPACVRAHRRLDAAHVPSELVGLGQRGDQLPCFVASRRTPHMSWGRRAGREIWRSGWPEAKAGVDLGGAHLMMRDDDGTGPPTHAAGRMGSKDPAGISGLNSIPPSKRIAGARAGRGCRS